MLYECWATSPVIWRTLQSATFHTFHLCSECLDVKYGMYFQPRGILCRYITQGTHDFQVNSISHCQVDLWHSSVFERRFNHHLCLSFLFSFLCYLDTTATLFFWVKIQSSFMYIFFFFLSIAALTPQQLRCDPKNF